MTETDKKDGSGSGGWRDILLICAVAVLGSVLFIVAMVAAGDGLQENPESTTPPTSSLAAGGVVWFLCGSIVYRLLRRSGAHWPGALFGAMVLGPGGLFVLRFGAELAKLIFAS
jgi:hypothetical protein